MWTTITLAALTLLAIQIILVAIVAAIRPKSNIYAIVITVALATAPSVFPVMALLLPEALDFDGCLYLLLVHLALGGFLFHFITLPDRSVTLRILVELWAAPSNTLSLSALTSRYSVPQMIKSRVAQLVAGGFIDVIADCQIVLKPKGQWFGRFVVGGRRLFNIKSAN